LKDLPLIVPPDIWGGKSISIGDGRPHAIASEALHSSLIVDDEIKTAANQIPELNAIAAANRGAIAAQ
jgi:hypothetical protein